MPPNHQTRSSSSARSLEVVEGLEPSGRRVEIPAELTRRFRDLDPEERRRRVLAYMEVHGEDVAPVDGWTRYGPKIEEREGR